MRRGIRTINVRNPGLPDSRVYFVKRKRNWATTVGSVRTNPRNKDIYIVMHKDRYRDWHTDRTTQIVVMHELGHCMTEWRFHWLNEIMATVVGWWNMRREITDPPSVWHVLGFILDTLPYCLRSRASADRLIARLHAEEK